MSENDPTKNAHSYAARLQELYQKQRVDFVDMAPVGKSMHRAGEGSTQRLPLAVSINGAPMDVLFTVSVGGTKDEYGRRRPVGYPNSNGVQNAVAMAAKNFAVVRRPYAQEQPQLIELTQEDVATGRCDYQEGGQDARIARGIPGPDQDPLKLEVATGNDQWDLPAQVQFRADQQGVLEFARHGQPDAYAMVAAQA